MRMQEETVMSELDQAIVEERQQLKLDRFVKHGHRNPLISIPVPLKGKLNLNICLLSLSLMIDLNA